MTPHQKQCETIKANLLKFIIENPGTHANDERVPINYRRFLRILETEQKIEYRDGWYIKEANQNG